FSGASAGHRISYDVSDGAKVLVRDLWYESGAGPGFANIHGRATFTVDGARISSPVDKPPPAFDIHDLNGRLAILSTDIDDRIAVSGDGAHAEVLPLGVVGERKSSSYFPAVATPPALIALLNSRQLSMLPGVRTAATANVGSTDASFIRAMLAHTREERPATL